MYLKYSTPLWYIIFTGIYAEGFHSHRITSCYSDHCDSRGNSFPSFCPSKELCKVSTAESVRPAERDNALDGKERIAPRQTVFKTPFRRTNFV